MTHPTRLALGLLIALAPAIAKGDTIDFEGTLTIQLQNRPAFVSTHQGIATVSGPTPIIRTAAVGGIAASWTGPAATTSVTGTDPLFGFPIATTILSSVSIDGTFGGLGVGPLTQGTVPVPGRFRMCIFFPGCTASFTFPLTSNSTAGLGVGGLITMSGFGKGLHISVVGAPWTVATAIVSSVITTNGSLEAATATGFVHGPASLTSTLAAGGVVQLVAPGFVRTNFDGNPHGALMTTLRLRFVPEPDGFLLLSSGAAALAWLARRRS